MKTIIILGTAWPYRGGLASFVEMMARAFSKRGRQVNIITFTLQYPEWLFPGKTQLSEASAPDGLNIVRMVNTINPFNWWRVGRHIRHLRPDALILKYWTPFLAPCLGTICRIAAGNRHTRILAQLDNVVPHEKHFYDRILTRYFVRSVHGFLYMSQQVKRELGMFTNTRPAVFAPHPVFSNFGERIARSQACNQLNLPQSVRYFLFFGLIRDYKGLDLMLDAWAQFRKHREGWKLIVAGEFYTDRGKYIRQTEQLGIGEDVLWHDHFIRDSDVKLYFSAASVLVQPYKSATQSGVSQIAFQFQTPMIVTNVGGLAEIITDGKTGYIVPPDAPSIALSMNRICDGNRLQLMAENMAAEKHRFSWDYFAQQLENLYEQLNTHQT